MVTVQNYVARPRRARKSLQAVASTAERFVQQYTGPHNPLTNPRFKPTTERLISQLTLANLILPCQYEQIKFFTVLDNRLAPMLPTHAQAIAIEIPDEQNWKYVMGTVMVYADGFDGPVVGALTGITGTHIELSPNDYDNYPVLTIERFRVLDLYKVVYCNDRAIQ